MRNGEKIARERQILINQITIMTGIKILLTHSNHSEMCTVSLDVSIDATSKILRGVSPTEPKSK